MFTISHDDALRLETEVRRLYKCDRAEISGLAEAGYFERKPIQAAIIVVSFIHAKGLEADPHEYDDFLHKYEIIFDYPEENDAASEVNNYIDELSAIVDRYV